MKSIILFFLLCLVQLAIAQNFTEKLFAPFDGESGGGIAFSDVDGDNDLDLFFTGTNSTFRQSAKKFINDGQGNFIERRDTAFDGIIASSMAFSDVDGDNDPDLFIMGEDDRGLAAEFYTNDGMGNFTKRMDSTTLVAVSGGSIAFADVDGDIDEDLLIVGSDSSGARTSHLYLNDGMGNFTEKTGTPFEGVLASSVAFSDVDGDRDLDLLITGLADPFRQIAKLYLNDGMGNFTEDRDTSLDGVFQGAIAFADVDGDDAPDLVITGDNTSRDNIAKLYLNDGMGDFTEETGTPFEGVFRGSVAFSDVDEDNDQDLLITGMNEERERIAQLYLNDGLGNFTEKMDTPFEGVLGGDIAFLDVDGDNDEDVLITGSNNSSEDIDKLYINETLSSTNDLRNDLSLDLNLFPNPTLTDKLYINYSGVNLSEVSLSVYDMTGSLLMQKRGLEATDERLLFIDIGSLSKGSYILKLEDGIQSGVAQFVVE